MATNRQHGIIFCYPQFSATRQRKSYLSRQRNPPPPEEALFGGHIWARPDSPAVDILNAVRKGTAADYQSSVETCPCL